MSQTLKQTIIVNNKPGAATNIAADYAAKSKDPTHTLLTADFATLAANPWLFAKLPYSAEKDFAPVGMLARFPLLLVVAPNVPAKNLKEFLACAQRAGENLKEFLAWAKSNSGGTNYASAGTGSPHHLATELFRERTGLTLVHTPYRGAAPAVQDLLGGQVPVAASWTRPACSSTWPRASCARSASPARSVCRRCPRCRRLAEQGLTGFEAYAWQGLVVPAAAPPEWIARLNKALNEALNSTAVKARFQVLGLDALPGTPAQMTAYVQPNASAGAR